MKYLLVLAGCIIIFLLKSVWFQLFSAVIFSIALNPLVNFMENRNIHRFFASFLSVLLLFYVFFLILLIIVPFIDKEILPVVSDIDNLDHVKNLKEFFTNLVSTKFSGLLNSDYFQKISMNFQKSGVNSLSSWIINLTFSMFSGFKNTFSGILSFFISVPLMMFFLLKDKELIVNFFRSLVPKKFLKNFDILLDSVHHELYSYLQRQVVLTSFLIFYYSSISFCVGISPLVGVLMGIVSIVPYLGFIINFFLLFMMSFAYTLPLASILIVFSLFFAGVLMENFVLIPKLFLHKMHSLYIFIFTIVFQDFVSLSSLLIAMPACVFCGIIFRYLVIFYKQSHEYQS